MGPVESLAVERQHESSHGNTQLGSFSYVRTEHVRNCATSRLRKALCGSVAGCARKLPRLLQSENRLPYDLNERDTWFSVNSKLERRFLRGRMLRCPGPPSSHRPCSLVTVHCRQCSFSRGPMCCHAAGGWVGKTTEQHNGRTFSQHRVDPFWRSMDHRLSPLHQGRAPSGVVTTASCQTCFC